MNKYNTKAKCPKCGCNILNDKHYKKGEFKFYPGVYVMSEEDGKQYQLPYQSAVVKEHIERRCVRCSYKWEELPLDAGGL